MRISDKLKENTINISCELFPPKEGTNLEAAHKIVREIAALNPAFMSVTYGAGGGTSEHTIDIANEIQNVNNITALAHLTCVSSDRSKVKNVISKLKENNIENILALRGDIPSNSDFKYSKDYTHACDLIAEIKGYHDFCIGGACYPEGHPEASSLDADIDNIKAKVNAGCEFLTTQMFFDNNILYNYMYRLLKKGVDVPIVAGIMPVTNASQIARIFSLSGTILPPRLKAIAERFSDDPMAMKQAGIAYATEQIIDLISNQVNNIHIYTMNKPDIAGRIFENLSCIYKA